MNTEEIIELKRRLDVINSELANFELNHLKVHAADKEILNRKLEENKAKLLVDLNKEWKEEIGKMRNDLDFAVKNSLSVLAISEKLEKLEFYFKKLNNFAERISGLEKESRNLIDKMIDTEREKAKEMRKEPIKEKTKMEKILDILFKRK